MAPKLFVIMNPAAGRGSGEKLRRPIQDLLQARGFTFSWHETQEKGHATQLAKQVPDDVEVVVVVGGDGTVNEVANGLVGKNKTMALLPIGSGNDFARAINLSSNYKKAIEVLEKGKTRRIDLGLVNGRYFSNGLGIGFDALVVYESNKVKKLRGMLIYLYAVIKCIFKYQAPKMRLSFNGQTIEKEIFMVTVGNGISLGGGFLLTPNACNDDGLFDLCIIENLKRWEIFWHLPKLFWGGHVKLSQTTMARADHIVIESDSPLGAHVDGELLTLSAHRFEAKIIPKVLTVVCHEPGE